MKLPGAMFSFLATLMVSSALRMELRTESNHTVEPPIKIFNLKETIDASAWSASFQKSFRIVAKVKFNNMNQNYPTLFEGKGDSGMAFVSHGLGGAYGSQKGLSCFYLQTTTNLGPHGRGIDYSGGWLPSKIRMDDAKWHTLELIKGLSGTAIIVDGQRIEGTIKDSASQRSKFVMKPVSTIELGGRSFDGEIGDVQIFTGGKQVYGDLDTGAHNLAKSLIPTGSSESNKWGPFEQATDGLYMQVWHAGDGDYPSSLTLNLGTSSKIESMKLSTPGHVNYGWKTMEIFRSVDGIAWEEVRTETSLQCKKDRVTEHAGWPEKTKFVKIVMKDRCGGGHFAINDWEIYGTPIGKPAACKGTAIPEKDNDRFPCDTIRDEKKCLESYMKYRSGEYYQCGVRKAGVGIFNCLVVDECIA